MPGAIKRKAKLVRRRSKKHAAAKITARPIATRVFTISAVDAEKRRLRFEDGELADYVTDDGDRVVVRARFNEDAQTWRLTYVRDADKT
jgi:hypothetical protein